MAEPDQPGLPPARGGGRLLRRFAWATSLASLAWLFMRIPAQAFRASLSSAAPWTVPALLALVVLNYLADTLAVWGTLDRLVVRLRFRDALRVRGSTYVLAAVSYALGQTALALFLHRSRGLGLARSFAAVTFLVGVSLSVLLLAVCAGVLLAHGELPWLGSLLLLAGGGILLYLLVVHALPGRLRSLPALELLRSIRPSGYLWAHLLRLPHVATLLLLNYVSLLAFGIAVPPREALAALPTVLLVACLPISVQGIGPTQGAMVWFFARHAPGEPAQREALVLAASLGTQVLCMAAQVAIGLVCLRGELARNPRSAARGPESGGAPH